MAIDSIACFRYTKMFQFLITVSCLIYSKVLGGCSPPSPLVPMPMLCRQYDTDLQFTQQAIVSLIVIYRL